jgi:hypothetical protein
MNRAEMKFSLLLTITLALVSLNHLSAQQTLHVQSGNMIIKDTMSFSDVCEFRSLSFHTENGERAPKVKITYGVVSADSHTLHGQVLANGIFDKQALSILKKSKGDKITIMIDYKAADGAPQKMVVVFVVI